MDVCIGVSSGGREEVTPRFENVGNVVADIQRPRLVEPIARVERLQPVGGSLP